MTNEKATRGTEDMGTTQVIDQAIDLKELAAPAAVAGSAGYASGWVADNNSSSHTTAIPHNLGYTPNTCQVWFTGTGKQDYLVSWAWRSDSSGNPVTISANTTQVFLEIYSGAPLHGAWDPKTGWSKFNSGSWRIVVS